MPTPKEQAELDAKSVLDIASTKALEIVAVAEKAARDIIALNPSANQSGGILKELLEIKSSLSVNTNETSNIKSRIADIQSDIKDIKNGAVSQQQFTEVVRIQADHEARTRNLEQWRWIMGGAIIILTFIAPYLISYLHHT